MKGDLPERAPVEGPDALASLPLTEAALPIRLRSALRDELGAGETIERIYLPPYQRRAPLLGRAAWCAGLLLVVVGLATSWGNISPWLGPLLQLGSGLLIGGAAFQLCQQMYVMTNLRCFRFSALVLRQQVTEISSPAEVNNLSREDARDLARRLRLLQLRSGESGAERGAEQARVSRDLPRALRDRLTAALRPGETLLWADRPRPRDYFWVAPLDPFSVGAMMLAMFTGLVAAFPAMQATQGKWFAATVLLAASSVGNLWRQMRGTAYAVTDQRGIVLTCGKVTEYPIDRLRRFQRTQGRDGRGRLSGAGEGFFGVRNVKVVEDLIHQRVPRELSTELAPADSPAARGDELSPLS